MDWKIFTVFFSQILGLSTVSGSCYYNSYYSSYYCYDYYNYYYDYYYYSNTLSAGTILGIIFGALAGLATLIGLIVCACVFVCRKPTARQGAVIYTPNTNAGTSVVQTTQTSMQPYNQQGFYQPYPGQMQATGQGEAFSYASPPQYTPPQQSSENQDPPPKYM